MRVNPRLTSALRSKSKVFNIFSVLRDYMSFIRTMQQAAQDNSIS